MHSQHFTALLAASSEDSETGGPCSHLVVALVQRLRASWNFEIIPRQIVVQPSEVECIPLHRYAGSTKFLSKNDAHEMTYVNLILPARVTTRRAIDARQGIVKISDLVASAYKVYIPREQNINSTTFRSWDL
jgi:hypothetical protein